MERLLVSLLLVIIFAACTPQPSAPPPSEPQPPRPQPKPPAPESLIETAKIPATEITIIDRESKIPPDQEKITPETDLLPPVLHSDEYEPPVPVPYPVSTAGAEDSAFIMPGGHTLYYWFTPKSQASYAEQLDDGVTGIYVSDKVNGEWQRPERIVLQDPDKQSLEGCAFVQDDIMWFCTVRTGYTGIHWFIANRVNGKWTDWEIADFDPEYGVGELHFSADGKELYFHSDRPGGKGKYDIWFSKKENGKWMPPQNLEIANSPETDGWPSLTQDGNELWFSSTCKGSPGIFRSRKVNGQWQEPELIISQFAAESSVDNDGNIYFTHHFYKDGRMLEADIYVAYKK